MGIFDIIGPVMVGPSSSHTAGAARIGQTARAILGEPVKEARITLYGSFAKTGKGHGTDRALAAGLMGYSPDSGTIRDALNIAKERGIDISFYLSEEDTLLTRHYDKPGVVAKVCEELAKEKINISTMRLFRKGKGSDAVMIIHTDQPVPPAVAEKVKNSNENITYVMALDII